MISLEAKAECALSMTFFNHKFDFAQFYRKLGCGTTTVHDFIVNRYDLENEYLNGLKDAMAGDGIDLGVIDEFTTTCYQAILDIFLGNVAAAVPKNWYKRVEKVKKEFDAWYNDDSWLWRTSDWKRVAFAFVHQSKHRGLAEDFVSENADYIKSLVQERCNHQ